MRGVTKVPLVIGIDRQAVAQDRIDRLCDDGDSHISAGAMTCITAWGAVPEPLVADTVVHEVEPVATVPPEVVEPLELLELPEPDVLVAGETVELFRTDVPLEALTTVFFPAEGTTVGNGPPKEI